MQDIETKFDRMKKLPRATLYYKLSGLFNTTNTFRNTSARRLIHVHGYKAPNIPPLSRTHAKNRALLRIEEIITPPNVSYHQIYLISLVTKSFSLGCY